jgi:hypothetical protein
MMMTHDDNDVTTTLLEPMMMTHDDEAAIQSGISILSSFSIRKLPNKFKNLKFDRIKYLDEDHCKLGTTLVRTHTLLLN